MDNRDIPQPAEGNVSNRELSSISGKNSQNLMNGANTSEKRNDKRSNHNRNKNKNVSRSNNKQDQYTKRPGQHKRNQQKQYQQGYMGDEQDGNFNASLEEEIINGNFKLRGRKTQVSIKHLLDFNLPEIERSNEATSVYRRSANKRKDQNREHIHLSGDYFTNVNSRFLVKNKTDYTEQMNNPNVPLPDEKIVRVVVPKGQNCPICLCEEPIAPRMVTCGHIFCASCLINFFSVEETIKNKETGHIKKKKYKDCPLCGNIVRPQRVKPVMFGDSLLGESLNKNDLPTPGSEIEIGLMCKPHGSLLPLPTKLNIDPLKIGNFPNYSINEIVPYSHIMKCDTSIELDALQADIDCINTQYEIDNALFNEDKKYVNLAIESINDKIVTILSDESTTSELDLSLTNDMANLSLNEAKLEDMRSKYSDSNAFYFYQTSFQSSTKFLLSHLDVKILLSTFKFYSAFPDTLRIHIENVHYGTVVTESLIKRLKYIDHLPLGTELAFIDIDWRNVDIIPSEVYQQFSNELKNRRRDFNRRKQKEDQQRKMYQKKLEEDQIKFYQEENGSFYSVHNTTSDIESILNSSTALDSLSASGPTSSSSSKNTKNRQKKGYQEKTIWGTSISVIPDEKTSQENKEFEAMLLQKMNASNSQENSSESDANINNISPMTKNGNKKKKGKVLLFSNSPQTF